MLYYSAKLIKMLTRKTQPLSNDLFQVHFSGTIEWVDFIDMYPDIIKEMDGTCRENCLLFYYEKNIVNQVYSFRDEDAEFDIANILDIDMNITVEGESIQEKNSRKSHSCNDIIDLEKQYNKNDKNDKKIIKNNTYNDFNNLDNLDLKKIKEENKRAKKERRQQKLLERTEQKESSLDIIDEDIIQI
jgi:hypothetical protein